MRQLLKIGVGLLLSASLVALGYTSRQIQRSYAADMLSANVIVNRNNQGVVLLDRFGNPFFTLYAAHPKTPLRLNEVPPLVRQAVIAAEDKEFYQHHGISLRGIARSIYLNVRQGQWRYGGSTITQQLIKNSLLTRQKKFSRKYQELILAWRLERRYTKDQILEMYLNTAYFGSNAFGIEQAAQTYFRKPAREITLAEASLLVGVLPAPSLYSPLSGEITTARHRQEYVLTEMVKAGYITPLDHQTALEEKITLHAASEEIPQAPHFALMVRQALIDQYGEAAVARSGMRVTTTLDPSWQAYAEQATARHIAKLTASGASNAAAVVIDPATNEIRALVGSYNWHEPQFGKVNMALAPRQTGSTFKPIVYAAAFSRGVITPSSVLHDQPTVFGKDYRPQNYDRRFRGRVLARRALASSLNVPAVEVAAQVGIRQVVELARELGITSLPAPHETNYALGLGAGEVSLTELTNAYSTFANQGSGEPAVSILKIHDKYGRQAYEHQRQATPIVRPEVAFMISSILSDADSRREVFGQALTIARPAAVKTGTTQDYRDAWTVGYTPQLAVGVWVGNNDNRPMNAVAGALGAAPLWRELVETFLRDVPPTEFTPPPGIVSRYVCRSNGQLVSAGRRGALPSPAVTPPPRNHAGYLEYFLPGTEPTKPCVIPATPSPSPELADDSLTPPLTQRDVPDIEDSES